MSPSPAAHLRGSRSSSPYLLKTKKLWSQVISHTCIFDEAFFCYTRREETRMPFSPQLVWFGLFELDLSTGELSKNGRKLKLQEQPFRLLTLLLENRGQTVTRDRMKEALWPSDTFVDFDHSLNAAVAKLRQALGDSAENPRFIETMARRGYRFIAPVEIEANGNSEIKPTANTTTVPAVSVPENAAVPAAPVRRSVWIVPVVAIAIAAVAVLAVFGVRFWSRAEPGQSRLVQLTSGTGLTMDPAASPDGKLLAYASDRADGRNLNVWIQQLISGGTAIQLTHFDADTSEPSFSPDGSRIVFRSAENGGGIYVIPTIGGEPIRVAPGGRNPRFSPDGRWIAYWTGIPNKTVLTGGEGGELYVVSAGGGQPRRLGTDLSNVGNPVWSPDSERLTAFCQVGSGEFAWCVISMNGEPSVRSSIFDSLKRQGFSIAFDRIPRVSQWTAGSILFSASYGDAFNVWRMPFSNEGRSLGPAERVTSGTTLEASPLLTSTGNLIFASLNLVQSVWSLPLDAESAKVTGELKKITDGPMEAQPSISRDGRKLAFAVNQNARSGPGVSQEPTTFQVRVKDLATGKQASFPQIKHPQFHPQISGDGTLVAYSSAQEQIEILRTDPWPPRVTDESAKAGKVWDWSADNKRLLFARYSDPNVYMQDRSARRASLFLSKPGYGLFQARFSPDDQSVLLVGCNSQAAAIGCRLFVAPLKIDGTPETDNWIAIPHPSRWDDKPRWSPGGNLIYFISDRDGQFCLWAQRVERRNKQLIGTPFPLYHFHNSRLAMNNVGTSFLEIDVSRDKIVMGLGELTGNIWSLQR